MFRFSFTLLGLFMFFFSNGTFPLIFLITGFLNRIFEQIIPLVGEKILDVTYEVIISPNGSGDTTFHYILLFCVAMLSIVATLIWTLVDRKRTNYYGLFYWLTVAVRFYVGLMLINYGLVKVIQLQFPYPSFSRLLTTYGESSPMGLAWTFLGFSKGYNLFMGIAELAAGLLLFRRTQTIGAIITLMTTANVMAVNYFYDVPVKIVSTALVVMCLFLLTPNFGRLFKLFFKGQVVGLKTIAPPFFQKPWMRIAKYTLKYVLIAWVVIGGLISVNFSRKRYGSDAPKSPLYGAYKVDTFTKNGVVIPSADANPSRWKFFIFQGAEMGAIKDADELEYMNMITDTVNREIKFTFKSDPNKTHFFNYKKSGDRLLLSGDLYGDSLDISLTRMKFPLIDRKLNWINERPYNR